MFKPNFVLSIFIVIVMNLGCSPPNLKDNTRILVKGNVTDDNGQAIMSGKVDVYSISGSSSCFFCPSSFDNFLLGSGETQSNGKFSIPSVFNHSLNFFISVTKDESYSEYIYSTDTSDYLPESLVIDIGTVEIKRISNVTLIINRESLEGTEIQFRYQYQIPQCREVFHNGIIVPEESECYSDIESSDILNDDNPNSTKTFRTIFGSEVLLIYSINGEPEITETFTITDENFEYNFSY